MPGSERLERSVAFVQSERSRAASASIAGQAASQRSSSRSTGREQGRPATGASEASTASRNSRKSVSTGRSSFDPSRQAWQVPTKALLGHKDDASGYSDTSSVRTATTIREFFQEESRWARGDRFSSHSVGRAPLLRIAEEPGDDVRPCVLPCVPPGKVPGGRPVRMGPSKTDLMYAPRALPPRRAEG
ncbi:unnamed protein product [Durusdinium trenchii]